MAVGSSTRLAMKLKDGYVSIFKFHSKQKRDVLFLFPSFFHFSRTRAYTFYVYANIY